MKNKFLHGSIIVTFVSLYLLVSVISTIHVIDFFKLSNPYWLAVSLAIGFELGAAASLASLVILDKMNKTLVWVLFGAITLMQIQGNMYYAFSHMENFQAWSELFGIIEEDIIYQKRILAAVSGAILPLVALGFIKSLVDYIKPAKEEILNSVELIPNVEENSKAEVLPELEKNNEPAEKEETTSLNIPEDKIEEEIVEEAPEILNPEIEEINIPEPVVEIEEPKINNIEKKEEILNEVMRLAQSDWNNLPQANSNKKTDSGASSSVERNPMFL